MRFETEFVHKFKKITGHFTKVLNCFLASLVILSGSYTITKGDSCIFKACQNGNTENYVYTRCNDGTKVYAQEASTNVCDEFGGIDTCHVLRIIMLYQTSGII